MLIKSINIIFILLVLNFFCLPSNAQIVNLSSTKNNDSIKLKNVEIYKPSKLVIGEATNFIVKAEPGTKVSLLFSGENYGSPNVHGQRLRLGEIADRIDGIIGEKGVIELSVELPKDEELEEKILFFEAVAWKKEDFSDLVRAKIMGINGRETHSNSLVITAKKEVNGPSFAPSIPGMGNMADTMDALNSDDSIINKNDNDFDDLRQEMYYRPKNIMLRNIDAPEIEESQESND